ncbi:MAG: hypothetical protein M1818_005444 [Claussenomyces sp. TS43310]|nr:MAG: hypothetical protein M1818_005444 [Claussenomyces sp. TS43310]
MPIRNPFAKRSGVNSGLEPQDEGGRFSAPAATVPAFEKVDTHDSKTSSAMSITSGKSQEPAEYKMSVVNDSGVYLPPSPPEKKGFWPRRTNHSSASSNTTESLAEIEAFSISRESFDSYRRSFDISAKSPVIATDIGIGRQSLDSARLPRLPRSAVNERRFERQPPTAEEGFEDVGLNDEQKQQQPPPKRRGFFSKFSESTEAADPAPNSSTSRFHISGRKRGQSGQGAELGNMERPATSGSNEVEEVK